MADFSDRTPDKNLGPSSPMRSSTPWRSQDVWLAPARDVDGLAARSGAERRTDYFPEQKPKKPPIESVTQGTSPDRFASPRKRGERVVVRDRASIPPPIAGAPSAEPAADDVDGGHVELSTGAARYSIVCKRLYCLPDPVYAAALGGDHNGEYNTSAAQVQLDADGIFAIVSTLEMCRGLHTLRLVGLQRGGASLLRSETLSAAMGAVRAMAGLQLLDLSDNALQDDVAAKPLGKLLANNSSLTGLILRSNLLSHGSAKMILTHLATNRTLLELDLSDNLQLKWGGQAVEYERLLKENVTLVSFGASLRPEPATAVLSVFVRSPSRMRRLALTMMPLGEEHITILCGWLSAKQCALTDLDLTHASTDAGGARLFRSLQLNRSLVRLTFAHNRVSTVGGTAFAEALRANMTLTAASLRGNLLTDAACVAIAAALAGNRVLTELDLGRNSINAIGAQALRQAMHSNTALTSLGGLQTLPISVGLRTSLEYYLRRNEEALAQMALEAERATQQREGMLKLLPPDERKLRKHIFKLEDETTRLATANAAQAQESAQVGKLLHETIRRNAELVDAVATLQNQVDKLRKSALGAKVAAAGRARKKAATKKGAKAPAPVSVAADPSAGGRAFAEKRAVARAGYSSEDSQGSLWEAGLQAELELMEGGLEDVMPGGDMLL